MTNLTSGYGDIWLMVFQWGFTKLKKYYRISFHGGTLDLDQNTRQISLSLDNWNELD